MIECVPLHRIDPEDERYRISEELDRPLLVRSMSRIGQLQPVIVKERPDGRLAVIAGFRRIRALARIDASTADARVLNAGEIDDLGAVRIALWDNISHRELGLLEKARVLATLKNLCAVPLDLLTAEYLPILGLEAHKNVLRRYLAIQDLRPRARELLRDGRISTVTAERICATPAGFQDALSDVLDRVQWSVSRQREVLDLIEELSARDECPMQQILERPEIREICLDSSLSPGRRGESIHRLLFRWRNPSLSRAEERFLEKTSRLDLPSGVRVSHSPYFEQPGIRVNFEAPTPEMFRAIADALHSASEQRRVEELFEIP